MDLYHYPVDLENNSIKIAKSFIERVIGYHPAPSWSANLRQNLTEIPLILYAPAWIQNEILENYQIFLKYQSATPNQLEFYLYYHNCETIAIFYWVYLKSINQSSKIIVQETPFTHVYLLINDEMIFDPLNYFIQFNYQHNLNNTQQYSHPYDFHYDRYIHKDNIRDWEQEELNLLSQL